MPHAKQTGQAVSQDGLGLLGSYETVLKAFKEADRNRDNKLNYDELHALLTHLNKGKWTDHKTSILFDEIDRNKSGSIDVDEFVNHIFAGSQQNVSGGTAGLSDYDKVMAQFRKFDSNKNGFLDKNEFTMLMSALKPGWEIKHTMAVYKQVDKDNSGEVSSAELCAYIFGVPAGQAQAPAQASGGNGHGHHKRGHKEPQQVLVLDMIHGQRALYVAKQLDKMLQEKFPGQVKLNAKIDPNATNVYNISAFNGKVVFWDTPSMIAYREDPFVQGPSIMAFFEDLMRRGIPRLLESMK